jgi:hypothetical protein
MAIIIGKAKDIAREEADRYNMMACIESTVTIDASFSLSGTTPVVVCSMSLPSDSVVVVGLLAEVIEEPSGVVGLPSAVSVVVVGCVCASTSLGLVMFSSSTVSGGAVFIAIVVVAGGFISVGSFVVPDNSVVSCFVVIGG